MTSQQWNQLEIKQGVIVAQQQHDSESLYNNMLICRPLQTVCTIRRKGRKGVVCEVPLMACLVITATSGTGGVPFSTDCCGGETIVGSIERCRASIVEQVSEPDDVPLAKQSALRFVTNLLGELRKRGARTLFRLLRCCAFRHTIRARIRARLVLTKSSVFCDLPHELVRYFGKVWL